MIYTSFKSFSYMYQKVPRKEHAWKKGSSRTKTHQKLLVSDHTSVKIKPTSNASRFGSHFFKKTSHQMLLISGHTSVRRPTSNASRFRSHFCWNVFNDLSLVNFLYGLVHFLIWAVAFFICRVSSYWLNSEQCSSWSDTMEVHGLHWSQREHNCY